MATTSKWRLEFKLYDDECTDNNEDDEENRRRMDEAYIRQLMKTAPRIWPQGTNVDASEEGFITLLVQSKALDEPRTMRMSLEEWKEVQERAAHEIARAEAARKKMIRK